MTCSSACEKGCFVVTVTSKSNSIQITGHHTLAIAEPGCWPVAVYKSGTCEMPEDMNSCSFLSSVFKFGVCKILVMALFLQWTSPAHVLANEVIKYKSKEGNAFPKLQNCGRLIQYSLIRQYPFCCCWSHVLC